MAIPEQSTGSERLLPSEGDLVLHFLPPENATVPNFIKLFAERAAKEALGIPPSDVKTVTVNPLNLEGKEAYVLCAQNLTEAEAAEQIRDAVSTKGFRLLE